MPSLNWTIDPTELIRSFETRNGNPEAGALFRWAARAVESLHYLDDIDHGYDTSNNPIGGHRPDVVDVAHARWAAGTCITAIDLCAAGLGRAFCGHHGLHELDFACFDAGVQKQRADGLRRRLPPLAVQWIDSACADPRYKEIKDARDWLTHSRVPQHFMIMPGGPPQRLKLEIGTTRLGVRQLIERARDVATQHISSFLAMLPGL